MGKDRGRQLIVVAAAVMFAGCNGTQATPTSTAVAATLGTTAATTTTPPTSTTPSSTTDTPATTAPSTSTSPQGAPSNEQLIEILDELYRRGDAVLADPSNADVTSTCAPETPCASKQQSQIDDMANRGEHMQIDQPTKVDKIVSVQDVADVSVEEVEPNTRYYVQFESVPLTDQPIGYIIGPDGEVVFELRPPPDSDPVGGITIVRYPEDKEFPWRFWD